MTQRYEMEYEPQDIQAYLKTKEKLQQEGDFLTEGMVRFTHGKTAFEVQAFVTQNGTIVPKSWEAFEDLVMGAPPGADLHFIVNEKKHLVFQQPLLDAFVANVPGVQHPKDFQDYIKSMAEQMGLGKLVKGAKDDDFVEVLNSVMISMQEAEDKAENTRKNKP